MRTYTDHGTGRGREVAGMMCERKGYLCKVAVLQEALLIGSLNRRNAALIYTSVWHTIWCWVALSTIDCICYQVLATEGLQDPERLHTELVR